MNNLDASIQSILSGSSVSDVVHALVEDDDERKERRRRQTRERIARKRAEIRADPEAYAAYLEKNRAYQRSKPRGPINKKRRERAAKEPQAKKDARNRANKEWRDKHFADPTNKEARAKLARERANKALGRLCTSCGLSDEDYAKEGKRYGPDNRCAACNARGRRFGWCVNKVHCLPPSEERKNGSGRKPKDYPPCKCTPGKVDPDYAGSSKKLRPRIPLKAEIWSAKPIYAPEVARRFSPVPIRKNARNQQVFKWRGRDWTLEGLAKETDLSIDKLRHYLVDKRLSADAAIKTIEDAWRKELYSRARQVRSERKQPGDVEESMDLKAQTLLRDLKGNPKNAELARELYSYLTRLGEHLSVYLGGKQHSITDWHKDGQITTKTPAPRFATFGHLANISFRRYNHSSWLDLTRNNGFSFKVFDGWDDVLGQ